MKKILLLFAAAFCAVASWATDEVTATYTSSQLEVALTNSTEFVAFQMDIVLDADVTVSDFVKAGRLAEGAAVTIDGTPVSTEFHLEYNQISVADGKQTIRVIAYNLGNNIIENAEGTIFTATISGKPENITIKNILFVDKNQLVETIVQLGEILEKADFVVGDINRSGGKPNGNDLIALKQILMHKVPAGADYDYVAADVNQSGGEPNGNDLIALIQLLKM